MKAVHPDKVAKAQKRLMRQAAAHPWLMAGIAASAVLAGGMILLQMYSLSVLIDAVYFGHRSAEVHHFWVGLLLLGIGLRAASAWAGNALGLRLAIRIKAGYRKQLLRRLHELGPLRLRKEKTGDLIALQQRGVEKLDDFYAQFVPSAVQMAVIPLIIFAVVMYLDWPTGLVFMITGPLIPIFMVLLGLQAGKKINEQWSSLRRMNAHFLDTVQGMDTLKLFGREAHVERSIENVSRLFRTTTMRVLKVAFLSGLILELSASVSTAVVAVEVGVRLIEGMIGFQMGMFLLLLAPEFYLPFRSFGSAHHAGMEGAEAGAQLFDMLGEKAASADEQPSPVKAPEFPLRQIGLDGVSFHYDASQPLLSDIDLQLQPGEIHALAGRSGSGKTTLMQLVAGLLSPVEGRITINDLPLSEIAPESWRAQVALVTQFPHLISGSLLENIRLGRKNADQAEIEEAVRAAQLEEVVAALPDGLETQLGENGMSLSGGERQRLALARAFLKQAPVLLLDEPAASLNEQLEAGLLQSLRNAAHGRIILMVTHRRPSLEAADRISILEHGRITQSGAPANILPGLDSAADDFIRYPESAQPAGVLS